jgi:hypothetical protein
MGLQSSTMLDRLYRNESFDQEGQFLGIRSHGIGYDGGLSSLVNKYKVEDWG